MKNIDYLEQNISRKANGDFQPQFIITENRILDFHLHEESDEMFYVIEGKFQIEFDEGLVELTNGDFLIVPRGKRHRPVIKSLVKCLIICYSKRTNPSPILISNFPRAHSFFLE